jgi:hypothetical protein
LLLGKKAGFLPFRANQLFIPVWPHEGQVNGVVAYHFDWGSCGTHDVSRKCCPFNENNV